MLHSELHEMPSQLSRRWWLFLLAGIAWLIIAVVVLRMDIRSVTTVGLMLGAVFLFSAVYQFALAAIQGGGWAVFRVALGVLFIGGGHLVVRESLRRLLVTRCRLRVAAHFERHVRHRVLRDGAADQPPLVARPSHRYSGSRTRLLGVTAVHRRPSHFADPMGRFLRLLPRHQRSRSCFRGALRSFEPLPWLSRQLRAARRCQHQESIRASRWSRSAGGTARRRRRRRPSGASTAPTGRPTWPPPRCAR